MSRINAVAYARYSTENQSENSIAYQIEAIQKYCSENNINIINMYIYEAKSGFNTDRDNFKRLLSDAKEKKFDAVIFYDVSRISRNVVDWFTAREMFNKYKIKLISCTETLEEADDPSSFLSESMKAILSHHFVMETRKKVIAGQTSKAKEGIFLRGTPPLGYDIVDGKYIINEYEAKIVRMIFDLYSRNFGYKYIIDALNKENYTSKFGKIFSISAIRNILTNERYTGTYFWNKRNIKYFGKWAGGGENVNCVKIENATPRIISAVVWDMVQDRLSKNIRGNNTTARKYILAGLLKCAKCGFNFHGTTKISGVKKYKTKYYICSNKYNKRTCDAKNINGSKLDEFILSILKKEILNEQKIDMFVDTYIKLYNEKNKNAKSRKKSLKKELDKVNNKIDNVMKAILDGIDSNLLKDKLKELELLKDNLDSELANIEKEPELNINKKKLADNLRIDYEALMESEEKTMLILKKYFNEIKISDDNVEISINSPDILVSNNDYGGLQRVLLTKNYDINNIKKKVI